MEAVTSATRAAEEAEFDDLDDETSPGPAPGFEISIVRSVHGAYHLLAQRLTIAARSEGLSAAEALVLVELRRNPGCTSLEIRRELGFHRSTLSSVLDRLERRGLIERARNAYDGRRYEVALTPLGRLRSETAGWLLGELEEELRDYTTWSERRGARAIFEACGAIIHDDGADHFD